VIDEADNIDEDINDPAEHRRSFSVVNSLPLVAFRNPFERFYQQRENTSSNRSSDVGNSQGER